MSLKDNLAKAGPKKAAAPSMIPAGFAAKKKEILEEEKQSVPLPDMREVIDNPQDCKMLASLVELDVAYIQQEKEIKRERKAVTPRIKKILEQYGETRCMVGGNRLVYYNAPRKSLSAKLLQAAGVSPVIIAACMVVTECWTLKVTPPGAEVEEEEV